MGLQEIKEKTDHRIYKVESNAQQRQEACQFAEAAYHNSKIDDALDWEHPKRAGDAKSKLLCEIERSALMLILERDARP